MAVPVSLGCTYWYSSIREQKAPSQYQGNKATTKWYHKAAGTKPAKNKAAQPQGIKHSKYQINKKEQASTVTRYHNTARHRDRKRAP